MRLQKLSAYFIDFSSLSCPERTSSTVSSGFNISLAVSNSPASAKDTAVISFSIFSIIFLSLFIGPCPSIPLTITYPLLSPQYLSLCRPLGLSGPDLFSALFFHYLLCGFELSLFCKGGCHHYCLKSLK